MKKFGKKQLFGIDQAVYSSGNARVYGSPSKDTERRSNNFLLNLYTLNRLFPEVTLPQVGVDAGFEIRSCFIEGGKGYQVIASNRDGGTFPCFTTLMVRDGRLAQMTAAYQSQGMPLLLVDFTDGLPIVYQERKTQEIDPLLVAGMWQAGIDVYENCSGNNRNEVATLEIISSEKEARRALCLPQVERRIKTLEEISRRIF